MAKRTRPGPVERVILELIAHNRQRRGRRYGKQRYQAVSLWEGWINYELKHCRKSAPARSGKAATRAAMRRFVAKHPAFALRRDAWGALWLYHINSRNHELADQATTEVAASDGSLDPPGEGIAARHHKLSSNHIPRT